MFLGVGAVRHTCVHVLMLGAILDLVLFLFQTSCIRLLEILPVVFGRLCPLLIKQYKDFGKTVKNLFDYKWLHDLMDWGKSQLKIVFVYWKRTVTSLLHLLKESCSSTSLLTVSAIENLLLSGELKTFLISSW